MEGRFCAPPLRTSTRWLKARCTGASKPPVSTTFTLGVSNSRLIEKLLAGADRAGECLVWRGATRNGYGAIKIEGVIVSTHRLMFELRHGPIPEGMLVCHECDNPPCIEEEHLFLGSHSDNSRDAVAKGRQHPPSSPATQFAIGNTMSNRRLSSSKARKVKRAIARRTGSLRQVALQFGLPLTVVKDISCGRTYSRC